MASFDKILFEFLGSTIVINPDLISEKCLLCEINEPFSDS